MSTDDEFDGSTSSAEYLESPNKAKIKALQAKLQKQGVNVSGAKGSDLQTLKLAVLKQNVSDKKHDQKDETKNEKGTKQGTKTREQQIKSTILTADTKPSAETQVTQGQHDEKVMAALKQDEVQGEDAS